MGLINMTNKKELNFENSINKLEKIVDELESGELSLEKSLKIFEEGIKLSSLCQKTLTLAEQKIQILTSKNNGEPQLNDFTNET